MRLTDAPGTVAHRADFPSFWEGLSLRLVCAAHGGVPPPVFPFLLGGTFIEARNELITMTTNKQTFPFLLGGTFIEASYHG